MNALTTTTQNGLAIPEKQAEAWLQMAAAKNATFEELERMELQAQSILLPVLDSRSYAEIDAALAEYRKQHVAMQERRKSFTSAVENGIIQPLMAFEKRIDPKTNADYLTASQRSLDIRKEESAKAELLNAKNQELAQFKAHVVNEYRRCIYEYKTTLYKEVNAQYEINLKGGAKMTPEAIESIKTMLRSITPPVPVKFSPKYLTKQEMVEAFSTMVQPDWNDIIDDACTYLDNTFANYDSDLANREAAIERAKDDERRREVEEAQKLAEDKAMNTLIAHSEVVTVDTPKIKRQVQITVIESEAWAKAIMAGFITNLPNLAKYIRVKSWAKLSIGQMAEYLAKYASDEGVMISGVQYTEIEK